VRELVPAACGGRVMSARPGRVIVACLAQGSAPELVEYGGAKPRRLGAYVHPFDGDSVADAGRFLLTAGHDTGETVVDLVTGKVFTAGEYQRPIAALGDVAVIQRATHLVVRDSAGERLLGDIAEYPETLRAGHYVYVEPLVVDLATGQLVGRAPSRQVTDRFTHEVRANVMAIASDGRLLAGFGGGRWDFTPGPLEWLTPTP
jgi:hypothetical protein